MGGTGGKAQRDRRHYSEQAARYVRAGSAEERAQVLHALDLPYALDEDTALALYAVQPALASGFIQRHLPRGRRAEDARLPWTRLMARALGRADAALHFALYRMQASPEEWARDTSELARRISDPASLCEELERRHPQRWRPDVGPHLQALALERGEHMLPYLERHAGEVWSPGRRSGYEQMAELAKRRGWWELWGTLVRVCGSAALYDREVLALLQDVHTDESQLRRRLLVLAGVWTPTGTGARPRRLKPLRESTLLELYRRFPHLARGPFRAQLEPSPARPLSRLIDLALSRQDDELIDHLAVRLAALNERSGSERLVEAGRRLAEHLAGRADPAQLDQRCAHILEQLGGLTRNVTNLARRNPLARLLFERGLAACFERREMAMRLLQTREPYVRALGVAALVRALRRHEPSAADVDALLLALEQPLPAAVRRDAMRALEALSGDLAARIAGWARHALAANAGTAHDGERLRLLAMQLSRQPALTLQGETPVVYRRTGA